MKLRVSIPNGLPRPFRQRRRHNIYEILFQVSIPNGLPRPFRQEPWYAALPMGKHVSIPNGLPRPFRPPGNTETVTVAALFQSRTGFPGHSDWEASFLEPLSDAVSIPNGLPRPFRLWGFSCDVANCNCFNPERASQAIPTTS